MAILLHFFLDTRATEGDAPAPLKLAVSKRSQTAFVLTGIALRPSEWQRKEQKVVLHPRRKILNADIARMKAEAEDYLRPMIYSGELAELSSSQIRDLIKSHFYGSYSRVKLADIYFPFADAKGPGTAAIYRSAWGRLRRWKPNADNIELHAVTGPFIQSFDAWLLDTFRPNTAVATMRCFRAAWNEGVRLGKCSGNPFEGINTTTAQTRSRDLSLEQIRALWRAGTKSAKEAEALDFFRLSFLLRAMNPVDLLNASPDEMQNGRIYYSRRKTGKDISVKVEPEAAEIIARRGNARHLFAASLTYGSFRIRCNVYLKNIAARAGLPPVTMYWARHTLASLLFEQGGSMDVVSAILSHSLGGARVTATYVAVRESQLDEAMRKVIDSVTLP